MSTASTAQRRPRGRPTGGGNNAEQSRRVLLDAAEVFFINGGDQSFTMEVIAREAGYSRSAVYRQFANRGELLQALVHRTTQRHIAEMLQRIPPDIGMVELLVESMVVVASQLVHDPLLSTIATHTPDGSVASLIAHDGGLTELVEPMIAGMLAHDTASTFRPGLRARDLTQFFISTALSMLLGVVTDSSDAAVARRYIETFVLQAIVAQPPAPTAVFLIGEAPG